MGDARSDGPRGAAGGDDRADRRVLVIAAVAMVALVLVGVVSAELFATSACATIEAEPAPDRPTGPDAAAVVASALPELDDDGRRDVRGAIDALTAHLGPVTGMADVRGAGRLVAVPDGVAAVGATTTVLDARLTAVGATADVGDGTVVGSGTTLYSLALANPTTGQVDALTPLGTDLTAGTCLDTATAGTPFAFLLDAGDGDLLLFRVEDDADDPEVELRDDEGQRWAADLELGMAPPGTLAARLSGRLGDDVVVVARRTAAGEDAPVLAAFERADGAARWTVPLADVVDLAPDSDGPVRPEVVTVAEDVVVVALSRDADADAADDRSSYVGLDADTGAVEWTADLPGPRQLLADGHVGDRMVLAVREDAGVTAYEVDAASGASRPTVAVGGATATVAGVGDALVLAVDDELSVVTDERRDTVGTGVAVADVLTVDDGAVVVLLRSEAGALAAAFGS